MTVGKMTLGGHHYFHAFLHDISERKAVQRLLEEKQQLLDAVLDTIDVGVVACSGTGELTLFNRAARELHGLDVTDIDSGKWAEHYSLFSGDGETLLRIDQVPLIRALSGESVHNAEMVVAPRDKSPKFLLASGRRLVSSTGVRLGAVVAMKDVTELKQSEKSAAINEQRLRAITENMPAMIGHVDRQERLLFLNSAAVDQVFQGSHEELIGSSLAAAYGQTRYSQIKPFIDRAFANEKVVFERDMVVDGERRHYHTTYVPDIGPAGEVAGFFAMALDITDRKNSELKQAESEERLKTITDNLPVLIAYIDNTEVYRFANATYESWFGIPPSAMVGKTVEQVLGRELYALGEAQLKRNLRGEVVKFETTALVHNSLRTASVLGIPDIKNSEVLGVYVMTTDITEVKKQEQQLQLLARSDALTGLANRRSYEEKLHEAALRALRTDRILALMYLDLDHFKQINDSLGHAGGDEVLREFATRLRLSVRATDTVCRLAGDEFTIIVEGLVDPREATLIAEKIIASVAQPFLIQGSLQTISTSIGIAYMSPEAIDIPELGKRADAALYEAKSAGRNRFVISIPVAVSV